VSAVWLDRSAEVVGRALAEVLASGTTLFAIGTLLAVTALRRSRPALLGALWTVVLLKFLLPVTLVAPVSLREPLQWLWLAFTAAPAAPVPAALPAAAAAAPAPPPAPGALLLAGLSFWLVMAALLLTGRLWRSAAARRAALALPPAGPAVLHAVVAASERIGLRRVPAVRTGTGGPYVVGCLRPVLVLPAGLPGAPGSAPAEREAMILHELAHLRRGDTWTRLLELVVSSLLFFWPPVWWACRALDRAREMACDQWAVAHGPLAARQYGRLLLAQLRQQRLARPAGAVALVPARSQLERRIDALLRGAGRPALGGRGRLAVLGFTLLAAVASARADTAEEAAPAQCSFDPGVVSQILSAYPEADRDGDGSLSVEEVCAHQLRMKRKIVDGVFESIDPDLVSRLDPRADRDGNGLLDAGELAVVKEQVVVSLPVPVDTPQVTRGVVLQLAGRNEAAGALSVSELVRVDTVAVSGASCAACECADRPAASISEQVVIDVSFPGDERRAP
jgi:beta-lactamase regulating signal transducer with metallopeptidase domain